MFFCWLNIVQIWSEREREIVALIVWEGTFFYVLFKWWILVSSWLGRKDMAVN
jgi:hypothetical protein